MYSLSTWYTLMMFVFFDQVSKLLASIYCQQEIYLLPNLSLRFCINRGIAFGLLQTTHMFYYCVITACVLCVVAGVMLYAWRTYGFTWPLAELAIIAGGLSNGIDRLLHQGVIDFISVHFWGWHMPVFNCADMCIVLGSCILLVRSVYYEQMA